MEYAAPLFILYGRHGKRKKEKNRNAADRVLV